MKISTIKSGRFAIMYSAIILSFFNNYFQNVSAEQPPSEVGQQQQNLESLISTNSAVCLSSAISLDGQRRQLIGKLMAILESTNSDETKMYAVVVLGKYRASEAVSFLVHHLEWEANMPSHVFFETIPVNTSNDESYQIDQQPITCALCSIGMPAIPALLDKITQIDDARITTKCVIICKRIEGMEVTQFRLQGLLDKETDPKIKVRIQSALDALKKLNQER